MQAFANIAEVGLSMSVNFRMPYGIFKNLIRFHQDVEVEIVKIQNPPVMEGWKNKKYTEEEILQAGIAKAKKIFTFF